MSTPNHLPPLIDGAGDPVIGPMPELFLSETMGTLWHRNCRAHLAPYGVYDFLVIFFAAGERHDRQVEFFHN